jgi:hypothetical protein
MAYENNIENLNEVNESIQNGIQNIQNISGISENMKITSWILFFISIIFSILLI